MGKSRLVQELCDRAGVPYFFFTATKGASPVEAVTAFTAELRDSPLPRERDLIPDLATGSWPDALRLLASALPDIPSVVVLDELPWLAEQDALFDGALQTAWDRLLAPRPVLLLLLGSDLHMMERLTAYDRPFYGRADNLVLGPLNPAETGQALRTPHSSHPPKPNRPAERRPKSPVLPLAGAAAGAAEVVGRGGGLAVVVVRGAGGVQPERRGVGGADELVVGDPGRPGGGAEQTVAHVGARGRTALGDFAEGGDHLGGGEAVVRQARSRPGIQG